MVPFVVVALLWVSFGLGLVGCESVELGWSVCCCLAVCENAKCCWPHLFTDRKSAAQIHRQTKRAKNQNIITSDTGEALIRFKDLWIEGIIEIEMENAL